MDDTQSLNVEFLADHVDALPILAKWLHEEWGGDAPGHALEKIEAGLKSRLNCDRLPMTLVAMRGGEPVGTASLKIREVEIRPEYEHWLGGVYVHPPWRGRGVGSALVRATAGEAYRLGIKELYLYTRNPKTEALYSRLGWNAIERPDYHGRRCVIMRRDLLP